MTLNNSDFHLPYNTALVARAKELRKNMTLAEKKLWYSYLKNFKFKVLRQRPIDHFIVDFYCPSLKLVIEIDGDTHFTDEGKAYDKERTARLESYGLKVIRFTNSQVLRNFDAVCEQLNLSIPP
ncbi:MAG: endonuclease domain-containing protein [Microcystis sp. M048S1]|uniref:endonuclease domain-containing protein n=1 Tax=unclassified Microcystis TaxID=2643300 RepID=UPI00118F5E0D|nr:MULTISPECIES: endonuclease domain-containing protein [unclassified Microcystis]MCA2901266.1 endonuclease domain-containing protein [Microcystis sp. M035S1]MCA2726170.1 endonuclease domain-containing protein [Microcystis sp. M166S2]MCA2730467.1 endonuclease domain-containing protein [Microcystis sp. M162S2]MCA2747376.1 endonuclease domain-containing protein [Microcystis sp. M155S2]MCA2767253.1 endonuclease domain-containing protein [Microcystis sp. M152S2]